MPNLAAVPVYPLNDECPSSTAQKRHGLFLLACSLTSQASSSCSTFCVQVTWLNSFPAFSLLLLPPSSPWAISHALPCSLSSSGKRAALSNCLQLRGLLSASKQSLCLQGKDLRSLGFMELKNICYRFHGSLAKKS